MQDSAGVNPAIQSAMSTVDYKIQYNDLNITCQIPSETLASIFHELIKTVQTDSWYRHVKNSSDRPPMHWVRAVSHVCSHWRAVALSTPALWSNLPMYNPRWALEMIERSKDVPLTIKYKGLFPMPKSPETTAAYTVLSEVFNSYLSRVNKLVLDATGGFNLDFDIPIAEQENTAKERSAQLLALAQQAAPSMEHLELVFKPSEENMLPNVMVAEFLNLKVLVLQGCAMSWELARFRNLRVLSLSRIPAGLVPSMVQLLGILSQTPLLETLEITDIEESVSQEDISSLQDAMPISFIHLKDIKLSCDLHACARFFDNVIFSRKASPIKLEYTVSPQLIELNTSSIAFMKKLAWKIQKNIGSSFAQLKLMDKIHCSMFSSEESEPVTTVSVDLSNQRKFLTALGNPFWQSLHLDQLQVLRVDHYRLDTDTWMIFGDLPHLTELKVTSNARSLLEALSPGMDTSSSISGLRPTFRALKSLTAFGWSLDKPGSLPGETIATQMVNCFKSRRSADLHLEELTLIMEARGYELVEPRRVDKETLTELRKWVKKVHSDFIQHYLGWHL